MLMEELPGPVFPAAFRIQTVDDVVLVEEILQSGIKETFHIPYGLDVGSRVSEGRRYGKGWSVGRPLIWRSSEVLSESFSSEDR